MPDLDSPMHLDMLKDAHQSGQITRDGIYGLHWGDPQTLELLRRIRDQFVLPYVHPDTTALEIGPGGGRWTRYLMGFGRLFLVDYHQEMLDEVARLFRKPGLVLVKGDGRRLLGVPNSSVQYAFSFGAFVHFEEDVITSYLREFRRVLTRDGCAVVQ